MNAWTLPKSVVFGDKEYKHSTDFRDVLEIIDYMANPSRPEFVRWQIAIALFYDEEIPEEYQHEAMQYLSDFISYGSKDKDAGPKLIDWHQDANIIVGDINKVAGMEVRAAQHLHWWTFLSYFYGIGEGQLSTLVSIRKKKAKGKKLEKWEQEYYRANKNAVDFQTPDAESIRTEKDDIMKWL